MLKRTLYISFDGLSDPLGQSQILPYLTGIAGNGYRITILSCEKTQRLREQEKDIKSLISKHNIEWHYVLYDADGNSLSRYLYLRKLKKMAFQLHHSAPFCLVHCRSYLPSLIGLELKLKAGVPFVFDMRGLWADERIDGNIWDLRRPVHRLFYNYFKRKEKQFAENCSSLISLTHSALDYLGKNFPGIKSKSTVIPCCTNTEVFDPSQTKAAIIEGIAEGDHVIIYAGSVGTWYCTGEMIDCMNIWKKRIPQFKLLIVTKDIKELAGILQKKFGAVPKWIVTASAAYKDMPSYIKAAKASVFFIKPAFSKIASSPTRMAECWAMDIPIITNKGIGDNDKYFAHSAGGVLLSEMKNEDYEMAFEAYMKLQTEKNHYRQIALGDFDTKKAIERYSAVYKKMCGEGN